MVIDNKDMPDGEKEDQKIKRKEHHVDVYVGRSIRYLVRLDSVHDGNPQDMLNSVLIIPQVSHQSCENKAVTRSDFSLLCHEHLTGFGGITTELLRHTTYLQQDNNYMGGKYISTNKLVLIIPGFKTDIKFTKCLR